MDKALPRDPTRKESWNAVPFTSIPCPSFGGRRNPITIRVTARTIPVRGPAAAIFSKSCLVVSVLITLVIPPNEPSCEKSEDSLRKITHFTMQAMY
jgi:hypothetical protein